MDYHEVRQLLEKYWSGNTSLEEERSLKIFFSTHTTDLPEDLMEVASLFEYYEETALQTMPAFSSPWDIKEATGQRRFRILKSYWDYAAIFILILASVWILKPTGKTISQSVAIQDTYQDPEQAMIATQKALQVLANNLNRGKDEMEKLALFHEAQQKVTGE